MAREKLSRQKRGPAIWASIHKSKPNLRGGVILSYMASQALGQHWLKPVGDRSAGGGWESRSSRRECIKRSQITPLNDNVASPGSNPWPAWTQSRLTRDVETMSPSNGQPSTGTGAVFMCSRQQSGQEGGEVRIMSTGFLAAWSHPTLAGKT